MARVGDYGTGWLLLFVPAGFCLAYLLTKARILNEQNVSTFATWVSAAIAAGFALAADGGAEGFRGLAGRLAIFGLVWVAGGLLFTLGVLIGEEKARKRK
ncbi:hypothetical protein [Noviherbaspirillum malthae]|uniref:hypothetical protein n=1 Tax=Noviherbaspirillum malthae TaxID=1260987 RepID=UPI00188EB389|nr:hypothetical protein [Noviherbaspirillum malthae]